jgi:hypothetical protein
VGDQDHRRVHGALLGACGARTLDQLQQVNIYTTSLVDPLKIDVELQNLKDMEKAMSLAWAYERRAAVVTDTNKPAAPSLSSITSNGTIVNICCSYHTDIVINNTASCTNSRFQALDHRGDDEMAPHGSMLQMRLVVHSWPQLQAPL